MLSKTATRTWWMLACLAALGLPTKGECADARGRPNILIIMSDDMGYSDIGCYGGEIRTPNLDALAANGLRFTQFYNTARCCPTRASLLTGLYPHQASMGWMTRDDGEQFPGYRGEISRNSVTIAEVLKPAGYRNYMVGKWHVARDVKPDGPKHNWPLQRGFDRFYGMVSGGGSFFDPYTLTRGNTQISPFADPEYKPATYYFTDAISDHAVRYLADHAADYNEHPFFMYVAYTAAHWPMHALPDDIARYRGKYDGGYEPIRKARLEKARQLGLLDPKWELSEQAGDWDAVTNKEREAACMEVYAAMVDRMDQGIGKIIAQLKKSGELDNTLIFFLQDNGGCAEGMGRNVVKGRLNGPRPEKPTLDPIPLTALPNGLVPPQTRDGYPVRQGPKVLPGPADSYIGYGEGWANVSNTPFREYKHWVHEGGISTPLIVHWPFGFRAKNQLRSQPGHLIDLMATCVDVSKAKYPETVADQRIVPLAGKTLVPAFENLPLDREAIYWEHEGNRAVRIGDWKLVAKGPAGKWELYDLKADRSEQHDLAAKEPDRVQAMSKQWEEWAKRANAIPWPWKPAYESVKVSPNP